MLDLKAQQCELRVISTYSRQAEVLVSSQFVMSFSLRPKMKSFFKKIMTTDEEIPYLPYIEEPFEAAVNLPEAEIDIDLEQNFRYLRNIITSESEKDRDSLCTGDKSFDQENPLHIAVISGNEEGVVNKIAAAEKSEGAWQLNHDGYTPLHLACRLGHLDVIKELVRMDSKLCLVKDKDGMTPLHTAAMEGRLDIMKELLSACPDSVMEVTVADETPFHIAMSYGQVKAEEFLLEWIKGKPYSAHLINKKDSDGNTLLHLAVSRKHLQIIKFLVEEIRISVNAVNNSGFTALDIFDALPSENEDTEIVQLLGRAGAVTANELANRTSDCPNCENHIKSQGKRYRSFHSQTARYFKPENAGYDVCLMAATSIATTSFLATFFSPRLRFYDESYINNYSPNFSTKIDMQSSYLRHLFVLFDSIAFVTSTALMTIILVRKLPLKPWLLVSVFSLFGAFTCSIKAVSPGDTLPVLFLGGFTLLAAVSEYLAQQFRNLLLGCLSVCRGYASEFIKERILSAQQAFFETHSCLRTY
ncbi:Ankyrin repeat-containing protein [Melia azedarach]|uniref:Ankyrin repeat-containing protein n=1 Tax=Melia azedarach TaxID=155640 RepID=A0ACC1X546_MELAZ|nr:Ankyrin repeat-containing protein [Melia azedarach]